MKKYFLILLIFVIWIGCNTHADNDPQQLRLFFTYPKTIQPDIQRFDVYYWQGDNPAVYDTSALALISTVDPASFTSEDDSMYHYLSDYFTVVYNYVGAGAKAVNDSGQVSDFGASSIHSYWQFFIPPAPEASKVVR